MTKKPKPIIRTDWDWGDNLTHKDILKLSIWNLDELVHKHPLTQKYDKETKPDSKT